MGTRKTAGLLVVGDAAAVASVLCLLEEEGGPPGRITFRTAHVPDLEAAHACLARQPVDVAVVDVSAWQRERPGEAFAETGLLRRGIPVLLLAAQADEPLAQQAVAQGAQDYLVREYLNRYWLFNALHYAIDRHRALGQMREYAARLQASEARFRAIIEQNADGILIVDGEGTIRFLNHAAQELLGRTRAELEGAAWGYPVLRDGVSELDIPRKDGGQAVVEMRMVELEWERQAAYLASLRDITEHKRVQEALAQIAAQLERSNDELRMFADVAGHDLREPLRTTTLYLQLLADQYTGRLDAEADHLITAALEGSRRMRQLIDALLAYTRLDAQEPDLQPVDVGAVLARSLTNLQAALEESGAVLTRDPLPSVLADPSQLEQVFQNLIGNAIKFRGAAAPRVHVSAQRQPDAWVFSVADNGIGIDKAFASRIFGMFERLHNRTAYPGTGIGLAICEKIVKRHGGRIWVESKPDAGATFYFSLPHTPRA